MGKDRRAIVSQQKIRDSSVSLCFLSLFMKLGKAGITDYHKSALQWRIRNISGQRLDWWPLWILFNFFFNRCLCKLHNQSIRMDFLHPGSNYNKWAFKLQMKKLRFWQTSSYCLYWHRITKYACKKNTLVLRVLCS